MKTFLTFLVGLITLAFNALVSVSLRFLPCAFDATNMNRVQVGTCTLWIYKTVDAVGDVDASGYFNAISDLVNNGDVIIVSDTNVPTIDVCVVTSADGASPVTILNGT